MSCNVCPKPTALTAISAVDCQVNLRQIQRLAFQRPGDKFDTTDVSPTDILLLADWQTKIAAADDTKIIVTPLIGGDPQITAGEANTSGGGDNSTLNGVKEVNTANPSEFSAMFKGLPPTVEKELKSIVCEPGLVVYMILQGGLIAAYKFDTGIHSGMPIQSAFVGDRGNGGFGTKDTNKIEFSLPAGWSEDIEVVKPTDFNPLTDI